MDDPTLKGLTDKEKRRMIQKRKREERLAKEDRISHLERMEKEDEENKLNNLFPSLENFNGPPKHKERTDRRWLWPIMTVIGLFFIQGYFGRFFFVKGLFVYWLFSVERE